MLPSTTARELVHKTLGLAGGTVLWILEQFWNTTLQYCTARFSSTSRVAGKHTVYSSVSRSGQKRTLEIQHRRFIMHVATPLAFSRSLQDSSAHCITLGLLRPSPHLWPDSSGFYPIHLHKSILSASQPRLGFPSIVRKDLSCAPHRFSCILWASLSSME